MRHLLPLGCPFIPGAAHLASSLGVQGAPALAALLHCPAWEPGASCSCCPEPTEPLPAVPTQPH